MTTRTISIRVSDEAARTYEAASDIALQRLVDKGSLYRSIRNLRRKIPWEGDVDGWRSSRTRRP